MSFAKFLSPNNCELLRIIHQHEPESLEELAQITGRAKSNLSRTLKAMAGYGLVRMDKGKGRKLVPQVVHDRVELVFAPDRAAQVEWNPQMNAQSPNVALRAALYLRVSTARQAEHDVSIPDQRKQGEAYCAARGYQLVEIFVEPGNTATNDRRPEFQRMIEAGNVEARTIRRGAGSQLLALLPRCFRHGILLSQARQERRAAHSPSRRNWGMTRFTT